MTVERLIDTILSIDKTSVRFKSMENDVVLIFWKETYPIASVFLKDSDFRVDYPRLYDMDFEDISKVFDSLEAYVRTALIERQIEYLI